MTGTGGGALERAVISIARALSPRGVASSIGRARQLTRYYRHVDPSWVRRSLRPGFASRCGREHVYIAPTGVQKERLAADELFVLDRSSRDVLRAPSKPLKQSACTPLFFHCYDLRDAGACIHSHSQATVMATLLWPGAEFRISHQEMIKVRPASGRRRFLRGQWPSCIGSVGLDRGSSAASFELLGRAADTRSGHAEGGHRRGSAQ